MALVLPIRIYRASRTLRRLGLTKLSLVLKQINLVVNGADISPFAELGDVQLPHPVGVVIGAGSVVEDGCQLMSGVVLGSEDARLGGPSAPVIRAGSSIGAGAKLLGAIEIGVGATIGANAVVVRDVPPGATVVGVPGRVVL